jgi:hypothetical protein
MGTQTTQIGKNNVKNANVTTVYTRLDQLEEEMKQTATTENVNLKSDKTYVDEQLQLKTNQTDFDTFKQSTTTTLAEKAKQTDLDASTKKSNDRFNLTTLKITANNDYSAWPQDKCFTKNNVLYVLHNEGTSHNSSDLRVIMKKSYDGGFTWDDGKTIASNSNPSLYTRGVCCWAAGSDGVNFYAILLSRGVDNLIGNSKHELLYGNPDDSSTWVRKDITLSKNGYVPNQFHSFASLPDGSIAFGYNYISGEVGIVKTFDQGTTWETHVMFDDATMLNKINLCEATLCYDSTNNVTVGFLRAETTDFKPKFWKSLDNCQTFTFYDSDISTIQTPIPIKKVGSKYYAFYSERMGECKAYLLSGDVSAVLTNGFSAFEKSKIGNLFYSGKNGPSGAGVASLVALNNNLHIFYSSENPNGTVDIYEAILNTTSPTDNILTPKNTSAIAKTDKTKIVLAYSTAQTLVVGTPLQLNFARVSTSDKMYEFTGNTFIPKEKGIYCFNISIDTGSQPDGNQSYLEVHWGSTVRRIDWNNNGNASAVVLGGTLLLELAAGTEVSFFLASSAAVTTRVTSGSWGYIYRVD